MRLPVPVLQHDSGQSHLKDLNPAQKHSISEESQRNAENRGKSIEKQEAGVDFNLSSTSCNRLYFLRGLPASPGVTRRPKVAAISLAKRSFPKAKLPFVARRISSTSPGSNSNLKSSRQAACLLAASLPSAE
jgi:hypothetical protein